MPIEKTFLFDSDWKRAVDLAEELGGEAVKDFRPALERSDICVTCTPSREAYLQLGHVHPGMFIAAVGADSDEKQEIAPALLASSRLFVDDLGQCAAIGDLHHALERGLMKREDVAGTLGEVIAGKRPGRLTNEELIVFDSTGTALQDVAAAALVYERGLTAGRGMEIALSV